MLAIKQLRKPRFEDEELVEKRLKVEAKKNGTELTDELINLDTHVKSPPKYQPPKFEFKKFDIARERPNLGLDWLLTPSVRFERDPNNPALKDFQFKTFDLGNIYRKTSESGEGVKLTLEDLKTKESKHGDITGYVTPEALNYNLQNKTWDDIQEKKRDLEDSTRELAGDALDKGFFDQLALDRLERKSRKTYGSEEFTTKVVRDEVYSRLRNPDYTDEPVKDDLAGKVRGILKDKRSGITVEPVVQTAIPVLSEVGKRVRFRKKAAETIAKAMKKNASKTSKPDPSPTSKPDPSTTSKPDPSTPESAPSTAPSSYVNPKSKAKAKGKLPDPVVLFSTTAPTLVSSEKKPSKKSKTPVDVAQQLETFLKQVQSPKPQSSSENPTPMSKVSSVHSSPATPATVEDTVENELITLDKNNQDIVNFYTESFPKFEGLSIPTKVVAVAGAKDLLATIKGKYQRDYETISSTDMETYNRVLYHLGFPILKTAKVSELATQFKNRIDTRDLNTDAEANRNHKKRVQKMKHGEKTLVIHDEDIS